ncbi:MAG: PAS domain-containing protein [Candidatus Lokiarchaeota archaeon]|nr:PAS domain-containing protein [Candidatus Lokiarchaeota archaeon]
MRVFITICVISCSIPIQYLNLKKRKLNTELKNSSIFLQNLFDAIQDGISVLDRDLTIIKVNSWMDRMYGADGSIIGKKCYDVYQQRTSPCPWCPCLKTIETGKLHDSIVPYPSQEKPTGWIELTAFPLYDELKKVSNVLEYVKDISKQMEYQTELQKSEVKYREAFNRADLYKDLFAHDISNLLQGILLSSEIILSQLNEKSNSIQIFDALRIIKDQVQRGSKLTKNVRKLSLLENHNLMPEPIEIIGLLRKSVALLNKTYQDKKIDIQIESFTEELFVNVNELIEDIFDNLLINAVNYNKNDNIEIQIKISKIETGVKIEFIDNGMGIEDMRKKEIFQRTSVNSKNTSGMGLGLSLVKKIVDSFNGDIWVENKIKNDYSKGSKFVLLIPEVQLLIH